MRLEGMIKEKKCLQNILFCRRLGGLGVITLREYFKMSIIKEDFQLHLLTQAHWNLFNQNNIQKYEQVILCEIYLTNYNTTKDI